MSKARPLNIRLSIIILFYHGEQWIDSCIQSLENQSLSRDLYEIILVDNGGSTPSLKKYKEQKNIRVFHFPINYGFAGGNNRALDFTRGEIVFFVNQDVVVHYNCLQELLNAFDSCPEAGAIGANLYMVSSRDTVDQYESPSNTVGLYRMSSFGYASYFIQETEKDIVPVEFVSGSAFGFRKSIVKDMGNYLFDSRLGSYMEDLDLSMRLIKTEWEMYVLPKAVVYHYRDEAFSGKPRYMLSKLIHVSSNRLMVYFNNLAMSDFIKKLPSLLIGIPLKVVRVDGKSHFNILMPIVSLGVLPLIVFYFGLRVLSNIEAEKEKSNISQQTQRDKKKWKWYFQVGMLVFFCGIASLFLYYQDWHSIYSATLLFSGRLLALLIGLTLLALVVTTLRNRLVFRRIGYSTRFSELFAISTIGQFSSGVTPGGVGTLLTVPLLKSHFQIPIGYGTLFATVDRLFGFYFIGCLALTGGLCYFSIHNFAILICFLLLLILVWVFFQMLQVCDQEIHRFGVPEYGGKMLNHLGTDLLSQLAIFISKLFYFSIFISQFLIITRALNYSLDLKSAWMIISVSSFGGIISMIPMGLVSMDASMLALSSYAGVPAGIGLIAIVLLRGVIGIPTAILGTICGIWLGRSSGT